MTQLEKKHKLLFSIFSLIPTLIYIISLFLPQYSKTHWITGETRYFNSFTVGLFSQEIPIGYLYLGALIINIILIILIIFIDISYTKAIYICEVIYWGCVGSLMLLFFGISYWVAADTLDFNVVFQIGYYLLGISWLLFWVPLFYIGLIIY